ncbi:AzlC family ABC transporter permease [Halarcobacter sp.]|uniref:AzlC family ABC transporter permease n=1 Tax=Halarcobacter sp. TaxID=2321133 RepID=UPI003A9169BA
MDKNFRNGFIANLPIGISVFAYGAVLGVLCVQKDIEFYQLALMNIFIFAGSSQFVIVDMWNTTLDIIGVTIAALLVNLRYFLVTASLNTLFIGTSKTQKFKYMHFVTDECWAITMQRLKQESITPMFLLGGGVCIFSVWFAGTSLGYFLGDFIQSPEKYGLDFAFIAIFLALAISMYKGKENIIPWLITIASAFAFEQLIDGKIYIVLAAILGAFSAVVFSKDERYG